MNGEDSRGSTLAEYVERVRAIPKLSLEDEQRIARLARRGVQWASDRLVEANLRVVTYVVKEHRGEGVNGLELIAEGNLGLVVAAQKFDPDRGTRFSTYAQHWVKAYVLDLIVRSRRLVGGGSGALSTRVYFRLKREYNRIANTIYDLEDRVRVLAESLEVSESKADEMLRQVYQPDEVLDAEFYEIGDPENSFAAQEEHVRMQVEVQNALSNLDARERYIVEQRVMSDKSVSCSDLGKQLGVSKERVWYLEKRAKAKIRRWLEDHEQPEGLVVTGA